LRSDLPIVMTSGLIDAGLQSSLRELGVREFVPKPATLDELSAAIARALASR
jgi:CheY-like chemotaxis protein